MIELANDPKAGHSFERAAQSGEHKAAAAGEQRTRSGHAWPFPSRYAARPAHEANPDQPAARPNGS